ncbi:MAG: tetratricopeptide repeat protein, partial [Gammaproteobacteria bacterium]
MNGPPDGQNITPPEAKAQVVWLAQNGRVAEARDLGRALCDAVPSDPEAWFLLGAIQGQLGDFADAEQCCRNALQYAPQHPELHYNLGIALLRQHKIAEAIASLRETVSLNPSHAGAWH